jgi:hypothetical protein
MPVLRETVHHASGTFVAGVELPDDHPLVVDAPALFVAAPPVETAAVKRAPGRPRKGE